MSDARSTWSDPTRRALALAQCAATQATAASDLLVAARYLEDPELRRMLAAEAAAESRLATALRERADALDASAATGTTTATTEFHAFDLSRGRPDELAAHGFFTPDLCDEVGDVGYVAMLHVAAQRATELFTAHRDACGEDAQTRDLLEQASDKKRAFAVETGAALDRLRAEGRDGEVRAALKRARSSRFIRNWRRLGMRSGAGFSRFVLRIMYWTVLLPFGVLSRLTKRRTSSEIRATTLRSQY